MTAAPTPLRRDRGLLLLLVLFLLGLPLVTTRIYASDEIKYFAYLHSLSFDHDLDFANDYQHWVDVWQRSDPAKAATIATLLKPNPATGLPINEAPIGTAILWAPAFGLAHLGVLAARAGGARVAADGYSQPYISAICYASYLYGCAGLLLIYALLRRYFTQFAAALAVLAVWLGTSAFFYMIIAPPWSHAVSLFTVALFTTVWMRTRPLERRLPRQWALLGFCAGLMMLVREQDALFLALPAVETLAWLWTRRADWRPARRPAPAALGFAAPAAPPLTRPVAPPSTIGSAMRRLIAGWALLLVVAAITFIPQLITYKVLGGRFAPSSTVGEKLNFLAPHALEVLFSPPYGLIPWAPVVLPALLGLLALARWDRLLAGAAAVAVAAQVWAAGSYSTWMGASSFGQRRFVNCTVLFAFGLAAGIAWLVDHGVPRPVLVVLALLFVGWEGGLALQYAVWSSKERQMGLQWPDVLTGEYQAYRRIPELVGRFLFNRASFYRNTAP